MKCLNKEIWKDIPDYEGLYQASNLGRIRSLDRIIISSKGVSMPYKGKILSQSSDGCKGYLKVKLSKNGKAKTFRVHYLIAITFLDKKGECINHKDGNKINNNVENLEWVTYSENNKHAYDNGLKPVKCKKFLAYSPNGEVFKYNNQTKCSKEIGVSTAYISRCLHGIYKSAKGWRFKYEEIFK